MTQRPYWSLETAARVEGNPVEIIRAELERAGTLSIRSDVPVGVSLSGGLDSSLVCALAHRATGGNIQAFSVGYPGAPAGDERALARKFADSLGITWHDVEISTAEVTARFPELMRHIDEPIADICGHPYFAVAELARSKGIPVLLSGLGGDELFWGYEWLRSALARTRRKSALQGSRAALPFRFLRTLMSQRSFGGSALAEVRALRSQWRSPDTVLFYELHPDWIAGADSILTVAARTEARQEPADGFARAAIEEDLDVQFTSLVFRSYLLCNGLTQLDRLTMAASVEPRLPLLDHRLVETVVGLRKSSPDSSLPPKTWLREAAADLLPAEILERPKQPFTPPVHEWLTAIRTRYGPLLDEGYLVRSGLVDRRALRSGPGGVPLPDGLIYRTLVLEVWSQENLPQPQRTPGHMTAAETL